MKKKLVKNSLIYLLSEIINKSIPFLLLPVLTKYLTPVEYGMYGMYQVMLSFFVPFLQMALQINITRNFFKVSKEDLSKILNTVIVILHMNVLIGLIIVFVFSMFKKNIFGIPIETLYLMPLIIYAQAINLFTLTILRNEEKALNYGILQFLITIFNFGSAVFLLLYFDKGWMSLIYGLLIGNFLFIFYSFFFFRKKFNCDFKRFYSFKDIYSVSIPLIFHLLGSSIIFLSDRIFIQQMLGLKEVGIYTVGAQFGMITMIVINAIVMAVSPTLYKKLAKKSLDIKFLYNMMILFVIIGIILWIISEIMFSYMINDKFLLAKNLILFFCIAFVFRGWYQLYYNIIVNEGKTSYFVKIMWQSALINIVLNYILIKTFGIIGAPMATAVAFLYMFIRVYFFSLKLKGYK